MPASVQDPAHNRFRHDLLIYFCVWTGLAVFAATQDLVSAAYHHELQHPGPLVATALLNWYTCALGTPLYVWLVRRYPLRGPYLAGRVALYVAAILACVVLKYVVWVPLENVLFNVHWTFDGSLIPNVFGVALDQLYFVVLLYAIEYYRSARAQERRAMELEGALSEAQLAALQSQLHPHFLFNTLNSVSALMQRDIGAADEMLARLSDMLRLTLAAGAHQEVPLRGELDILSRYLEIMQVRFGDQLHVELDVPDDVLDESVPSFLLQPIVENTLRHGMQGGGRTTTVTVSAIRSGIVPPLVSQRITTRAPAPAAAASVLRA